MTDCSDEPPRPEAAAQGEVRLTREALLDGSLHRMIARTVPDLRLLSDAERTRSLQETLAARPAGERDGAWLFAYGSLIWNPMITFTERRVARVQGWQRAFCLSIKGGRGSHEQPGLMLALDCGGSCTGVALHIAEGLLCEELEVVWRREMLAGSYVPRWLEMEDEGGRPFGHAITFTINTEHPGYIGGLSETETVQRLATASGAMGSSAEYLFRTREGLRALGVADPLIERLAAAVSAAQAARSAGSAPPHDGEAEPGADQQPA
jgi:glutathione-specific gamma-glutamylcyclotransferase